MPPYVAIPGDEPDPSLAAAIRSLRAAGYELEPVRISTSRLPRRVDRRMRKVEQSFRHTPDALVESWRAAQWLAEATRPGDAVVIGDRAGIGGMSALIESTRPPEDRRQIWTVAGDGISLEHRLVTGTFDGIDAAESSLVDWELAQYRFSAEVLATSERAMSYLGELGIRSSVVNSAEEPPDVERPGRIETVWAPGPVSRRNRSGAVMRAVASVPDMELIVGETDVEDLIWKGTTWEAVESIRRVLGERLERSDLPTSRPAAVVIGDALAPPEPAAVAMRDAGVATVVGRGSVAAAMWPEAETWESSDDLADVLTGGSPTKAPPTATWNGPSPLQPADDARARAVSVGVPVFGDVRYLDECVASILSQEQHPHEVILLDDGSESEEVDAALARWEEQAPEIVRTDRQPNRGVCVARNRMIEMMTGDAFLLVDQDDVLEPSFVRRTAEALRQDAGLAAVATWTEFFGDYQGIEAKPPFDRRVGRRENPIVSTAALVDMRVVRDLGIRYAPDLAFLYCEDWHFWSQVVAAGDRFGLVPEPLVRHRVHQGSGASQRTERAMEIGRARAVEPLAAPRNASSDATG